MRDYRYGWCHGCETFQLRFDAPILSWGYLEDPLCPGLVLQEALPAEACCVVCREAEPWSFGVWNAAQFVTPDLYSRAELRLLCEQRVSGYPGDVRPKWPGDGAPTRDDPFRPASARQS